MKYGILDQNGELSEIVVEVVGGCVEQMSGIVTTQLGNLGGQDVDSRLANFVPLFHVGPPHIADDGRPGSGSVFGYFEGTEDADVF